MRIALVHYSAPPVIGGVERVLGEQQAVLQRMGHEVSIITSADFPKKSGHSCPQGTGTFLSPQTSATPFYSAQAETLKRLPAKLPHWTQDGVFYFLTWRLSDALPAEASRRLRLERDAWLSSNPKPWNEPQEREYHERFTQRYEALMDEGYGSCLLRKPENAQIVEEVMRHGDGERFALEAFVIMPNHVHALLWVEHRHDLEKIVKAWKGVSARRINEREGREGELWQADYYDRMVRDLAHLSGLKRYVQRNPEKAKLREGRFRLWLNESGHSCPQGVATFQSPRHQDILVPASRLRSEGTGMSPSLGDRNVPAPWEQVFTDIDLVIVHNLFTMPFDLVATKALRELAASSTTTKWINWVHDVAAVNPNYAHLPWNSEDHAMLKSAPPNCTHVAVSEIRQIEYCGLTQLPLEQCRVVPNGVDVAKVLNLSPRIADLIEPLRLWERDFVLVHPARILRRKNIELGLRVVKALQKDSLDVAYLISGAPDPHNKDGLAYGSELHTLVQELGLQDSAFFLGEDGPLSDDDVRSLYCVSDALLFPSKSEGFGLPIVEAALHGLPVFCSDIAAHREIGQSVGSFFDLDEDPALIACSIAEHPGVEARYVRRTTLAGWLDWSKIAVTYLEPLLHDVSNP